jgi:hypothetical protein
MGFFKDMGRQSILGAVPKGLRERSAKPLFAGSSPARTFKSPVKKAGRMRTEGGGVEADRGLHFLRRVEPVGKLGSLPERELCGVDFGERRFESGPHL